tara:strand:+ start:122 stop:346 length:225 start_codon:yes stop_codon:yes gene_type:complete
MLLSDNIYDYYLLDNIKKRIIDYKKSKNKQAFNKYLRFACESEILLWTHINKVIDKTDLLLIKKTNKFHIKRRG